MLDFVVIAAVILAFSGRYPDTVFDFVMGLNRWCVRVLVYALLLRDEYPPFRLDTGGTDPGTRPMVPPVGPLPPGEPVRTRGPVPPGEPVSPA